MSVQPNFYLAHAHRVLLCAYTWFFDFPIRFCFSFVHTSRVRVVRLLHTNRVFIFACGSFSIFDFSVEYISAYTYMCRCTCPRWQVFGFCIQIPFSFLHTNRFPIFYFKHADRILVYACTPDTECFIFACNSLSASCIQTALGFDTEYMNAYAYMCAYTYLVGLARRMQITF